MAKTFFSPGVFTNEIDASFLGAGVGSIGAALIGTAPQGPAFVPVTVTNFSEFTSFFGDLDTRSYLGYAGRAYLKNAEPVILTSSKSFPRSLTTKAADPVISKRAITAPVEPDTLIPVPATAEVTPVFVTVNAG